MILKVLCSAENGIESYIETKLKKLPGQILVMSRPYVSMDNKEEFTRYVHVEAFIEDNKDRSIVDNLPSWIPNYNAKVIQPYILNKQLKTFIDKL